MHRSTSAHAVAHHLLASVLLACTAVPALAQVGMTELRLAELPVTLVYRTGEHATPSTFGPVTVEVARDAVPTPGRRRLVVLSHGTGGRVWVDHAWAVD